QLGLEPQTVAIRGQTDRARVGQIQLLDRFERRRVSRRVSRKGVRHVKTADLLRRPRTEAAVYADPQSALSAKFPDALGADRLRRLFEEIDVVILLTATRVDSRPGDPGVQMRRHIHAHRRGPYSFALEASESRQFTLLDQRINQIPGDLIQLHQQHSPALHNLSPPDISI